MVQETEKSPYYLRITATPNCNLRCIYCNPEGLFGMKEMSDNEIIGILQAARSKNIQKIHWTGGEPTLRKGMVGMVEEATRQGFTYQAITTNGVLLNRDIESYRKAGLTGVSISLDSLQRDRVFALSGGRDVLNPVYSAIVKSCSLFPEVVVNTVVTPTNVDEIHDFLAFARKMDCRFIPRFCELQNYGPAYEGKPGNFLRDYISRDSILEILSQAGELEDIVRTDVDKHNANAEYFKMRDGLIAGIIAPYTNRWPCAEQDCNKIRIGPLGTITPCVHSSGYELAGKSHQEKQEIFEQVILEKDRHKATANFPSHHIPAYKTLRFGLE